MDLVVRANGQKVAVLEVAKWYFDTLTVDQVTSTIYAISTSTSTLSVQAFQLACGETAVQERVLHLDIDQKSLVIHEDYEAHLEITYTSNEDWAKSQSPEEYQKYKAEMREKQKVEKAEKKAQREKRKKEYDENMAKKEKIIKTNPKYPNKVKFQ